MIVLSCKDICKSYGIRDILKNITFSINEGDKVGVIGPNGEGKSTLFKILTKELSQDSGQVTLDTYHKIYPLILQKQYMKKLYLSLKNY